MNELKIQNKKPGHIEFMTQNVEFKTLAKLYNQCHCFVIPSLAESFHMGGLQAMSCGLPVLANNFGGQTDYVNENNGWLLKEGKMKEVDWDLLYEGIKWKLPNIQELREHLRRIYNQKDLIWIKGNRALETANNFTWDIIAKKVIDVLK